MSSSLSTLRFDLMWVLDCRVFRCGVLGLFAFAFWCSSLSSLSTLWGVRAWIRTRLPLELASSQFQPKYIAYFSYELKADRLSLWCSRCERLKYRRKYKAPRPFAFQKGCIHVFRKRLYAESQSNGANIGTARRVVNFGLS